MATLTVTLTAADGTSQQVTLPVTVLHGFYPGSTPGPATYPGKGA